MTTDKNPAQSTGVAANPLRVLPGDKARTRDRQIMWTVAAAIAIAVVWFFSSVGQSDYRAFVEDALSANIAEQFNLEITADCPSASAKAGSVFVCTLSQPFDAFWLMDVDSAKVTVLNSSGDIEWQWY